MDDVAIATLTLKDPSTWSPDRALEVEEWLYAQAEKLRTERKQYAKRFRARYFVPSLS